MTAKTILNLDKIAAERAQKIVEQTNDAKTLERLATKTLGVLQEQGVYACMLFLFSRSSDEAKAAPVIRAQLFQALVALPAFDRAPDDDDDAQTALSFFSDHVLNDLDLMLLVHDLYEQTLIYARYGAKAAGG
ncbi:MAG TPA: hypothetical protein ENN19_03255 [Chloroflexi bacterium]|nr:hypothetical protein [Chloroflexota bacterium]